MNNLEAFQKTIEEFLDNLSASDIKLAERLCLESKNIEDCCKYIIAQVKKADRCVFSDEEVFNMAVEYYVSDDVKVEDVGGCTIKGNLITEPDKKPIYTPSTPTPTPTPTKPTITKKSKNSVPDNQMSLF